MLKIEGLSQSGDLVSTKEVKRKTLPTSLTLWYIDVKDANEENWDQLQTPVVTVSTEEDLWNVHRLLIASNNQENTDFSLFHKGISPDWNDTKNVKGGRWVIGYKVKSPTFMWRALITQLIQNEKINGVVVSARCKNSYRVALWLGEIESHNDILLIGKSLKKNLQVNGSIQYRQLKLGLKLRV